MKIALIAVGSVIAAIALVAICGALLPQHHVASRQARFRRSPEELWPAIAGYKSDDKLTYKTEESDPPRRLVTRVIDPGHNFGGTWTWEVQPTPEGASLRITEHGEVYNPIFRFVSRFLMGHTATIDTALHALAAQFGEQIRIED